MSSNNGIDWSLLHQRLLETPVIVPPKLPSRKPNPEVVKAKRDRFYARHKDDPAFKEKKAKSNKTYKDSVKDDPEYKAKRSKSSKLYKLNHKDDPVFKAKRAEANRRYRARKRLAA